jgi:hypothetical protein
MFLSIEQRLHTSFDIFIPIRRSLQIEKKIRQRNSAALLLLDLLSSSHFQPMRKIHHVNNPSDVLKSQPTNSSGSKKRKGLRIQSITLLK